MLFGTRPNSLYLTNNWSINFLDRTPLEKVEEFKYLGLWLDSQLSFKPHINSVIKRRNCSLRFLYHSINCFTLQVRKRIISQLILPILDYADNQNTSETNLRPLNVVYILIEPITVLCMSRYTG